MLLRLWTIIASEKANTGVVPFNQPSIGKVLPEPEPFIPEVAAYACLKNATSIAIASSGIARRRERAVGSIRRSPEGRGVRHISRQRKILVLKRPGSCHPPVVFRRHGPQLRRADQRLTAKDAAGQKPEDDEHNGELDEGKARLRQSRVHVLR